MEYRLPVWNWLRLPVVLQLLICTTYLYFLHPQLSLAHKDWIPGKYIW